MTKTYHQPEAMLEQAILFALQAHANQIDADGQPHIVHALEVMFRVKQEHESNLQSRTTDVKNATIFEIMAAAVLHDVIEDTPNSKEIIAEWFGELVAEIVDTLSRRKEETYRDFIYRTKELPAARLIKVADLLCNRARTHKISEKRASWRNKLEYKYDTALKVLNGKDEPTWEGASFQYLDGKRFIADPSGERIEISELEAERVKICFRIAN